MTAYVIDASVTMSWCFDDEVTPRLDELLDRVAVDGAVVPPLWRLEVSNVLLAAQRRARVTEAQVARFVELLEGLPISVEPEGAAISQLIAVGREHELSAYDAEYLILAARCGLPLATSDEHLRAAATAAGVQTA